MIQFHRKKQFDIIKGGIEKPILVIAWVTPSSYSRLFCLWLGGVWVRWFGKQRLCWQWGGTTKRATDGFSAWAGDDDQGDGIGFAEVHGW